MHSTINVFINVLFLVQLLLYILKYFITLKIESITVYNIDFRYLLT